MSMNASPQAAPGDLLTVREAAQAVGVSADAVQAWIRRGLSPFLLFCGVLLVIQASGAWSWLRLWPDAAHGHVPDLVMHPGGPQVDAPGVLGIWVNIVRQARAAGHLDVHAILHPRGAVHHGVAGQHAAGAHLKGGPLICPAVCHGGGSPFPRLVAPIADDAITIGVVADALPATLKGLLILRRPEVVQGEHLPILLGLRGQRGHAERGDQVILLAHREGPILLVGVGGDVDLVVQQVVRQGLR